MLEKISGMIDFSPQPYPLDVLIPMTKDRSYIYPSKYRDQVEVPAGSQLLQMYRTAADFLAGNYDPCRFFKAAKIEYYWFLLEFDEISMKITVLHVKHKSIC